VNQIFGATYADAYDLLYLDKNYSTECNLIDKLFHTCGNDSISTILNLSCGTGNDAFPLAGRGYEVVGVDGSKNMLAQAREKLTNTRTKLKLSFREGDLRSVKFPGQFDAALMMFAVLGYQLENRDVLAVLTSARQNLRAGALLIFDVWYGPAVLHQRPSEKARVLPVADGKILRFASGKLDISRHVCSVQINLWRISGERLLFETEETHLMRYFFPLELSLFLESSGFNLIRLGTFPEFDKEPDETSWNVLGVACAV
jgi:SAM-dependent methyltransferase